jgi:hypothetical protein
MLDDAVFRSQEHRADSFEVRLRDDNFRLTQDIRPYLAYASLMRGLDANNPRRTRNYRPYFILPDIVAIDILTKYGIDVHAPDFMKDPAGMRKLEQIVLTEYPHLLLSNINKT